MTRYITFALVAAVTAVARPAAAELNVVATTPKLAALARAVGGDRVAVRAMSLATQNPHWVDPRPDLIHKLAQADLLLAIGLELEVGWLPGLQRAARNRAILPNGRGHLDCSTLISPLEVPRGRIDRSMGDVHPGGNPHYLWNPRQAARVAEGIADRMSALDPAGQDVYIANVATFQDSLRQGMQRWEAQLHNLEGAEVVAYHKSFAYLADWLGFTVVEHLEPRPGIPPNPQHVARVLATTRQRGVSLIIQETYHPSRTAKAVADLATVRFVRLPSGPTRNGETYLDYMNRVVGLLAGER